MNFERSKPLKIGIIGAGFSGTAMAATLNRLAHFPIDIVLFDKRGVFGVGDAYSTPYPFHLLNARARDMSAFEDTPQHFVSWLNTFHATDEHLDKTLAMGDQFVSRSLYGNYLNNLLQTIKADPEKKTTLQCEPHEVLDIIPKSDKAQLILSDNRQITVDIVILALGNGSPTVLPFSVSSDIQCITNPWDYTAPKQIASDDPVLIIGTGLSMIDAVLTLHHQQHKGKIYAVSRRGLLPLPHADSKVLFICMREHVPTHLRLLAKYVRTKSAEHKAQGGDWRSVINALRPIIPQLWADTSLSERKRFLRHVLPYWNIHRHRVNAKVADLLTTLSDTQQLTILSGRIQSVNEGKATIKLRKTSQVMSFDIKWLINCMGPQLNISTYQEPLVKSLLMRGIAITDSLQLGFDVTSLGELKTASGKSSSIFYTLGSFRKGVSWEAVAVPEIRLQCFELAKHIIENRQFLLSNTSLDMREEKHSCKR